MGDTQRVRNGCGEIDRESKFKSAAKYANSYPISKKCRKTQEIKKQKQHPKKFTCRKTAGFFLRNCESK